MARFRVGVMSGMGYGAIRKPYASNNPLICKEQLSNL